jgi:hypothetical protein
LVSAAEFIKLSAPDPSTPAYIGPIFPVADPPEESDSKVVSDMVNLLLCNDHLTAFYLMAVLLNGTHNCQLKMSVFHTVQDQTAHTFY